MIKAMKKITWYKSLLVFLLFCSFQLKGQITGPVFEKSHYIFHNKTVPLTNAITPGNVASESAIPTPFTSNVVMPAELTIPHRKIVNAMFSIKVNLGDNYIYGPSASTENAPLDFKYKVSFDLLPYNGSSVVNGVFDRSRYEIIIENNKPEAVFVKNLAAYSDIGTNSVGASDFIFQRLTISNVTITPIIKAVAVPSVQATMLAKIANSIRFEISYDIEYGIDVVSTSTKPVITSLSATRQTSKQIAFNWNNNGLEFPNYEFQLLRLYNTSSATASSEEDITTEIDWSKALRIETESSKTSLAITVAEGTGFYVWRVRPIGTFHEGGIANNLNYSDNSWSTSLGNITDLHLQVTSNGIAYSGSDNNPFFYFSDPEEDKNWIYSRVFSEGNKTSESLTYATPLQQVRQTQTYRASKDTTLVTQTIQDHSGRPALSTLNIPVPGKLGDYKEKFVKKEGTDELYKAKDFDDASNYNNPSRVNQDNTAFSYYSDQNPNLNVPSAEGYPFQRTLFYNDGTQRVKEQSGVGKTHMIGDGSTGSGRGQTVKTEYGTPSEDELVALFGDEAPSHESVLKTVTIDQNNTASVSYTSKEGQVIATGLSFKDGDDSSVLEPLNGQGTPDAVKSVRDAITRNFLTEKGFVSSKRIALLQATPIDISYKVKCQELEQNCLTVELDCKYKVKVVIHNVNDSSATIVLESKSLSSIPCTPEAPEIGYKSVSWPQQNLAAGTYVIEKILEVGDARIVVDGTKAEEQIMPLIKKITGWLEGVDCEAELQQFYTDIDNFKNDINNAFSGATSCNAECVVAKYGLGSFVLTQFHKVDLLRSQATNKPSSLLISSPCCQNMSVSVLYNPPFRCPAVFEQRDSKPENGEPNGVIEVNSDYFENPGATEYFPDLEGYALALLKDCFGEKLNEEIFYSNYMIGWSNRGDFNKMVYHMLTDKYDARGAMEDATSNNGNPTPTQEVDDCGNVTENTGVVCTEDPLNNKKLCTQYTCSELVNCWAQQVLALKNALCPNAEYNPETPSNISNRTDKEAGEKEGEGETHDNHFNDNFDDIKMRRRKKRKLKRKIHEAMRDMAKESPAAKSEYKAFLVKDFLDCTGYKFAKILTSEDPLPLQQDVSGTTGYNVPFNGEGEKFLPCPSETGCKQWPYRPATMSGIALWPSIIVEKGIEVEGGEDIPPVTIGDMFPNIKDPLYAFKYFEYPDDKRNREVEVMTCYSDPNDCYKLKANGDIDTDNEGRPLKIPCCFSRDELGNYTFNTTLCDTAVPTPNGDGNHASAGVPLSGPIVYDLRYDVKEFCDMGKVKCPYDSRSWSAGQRYTFFTMLKTYMKPEEEEEQREQDECEMFTTLAAGAYDEDDNPIGLTDQEVANWKDWNGITSNDEFVYPTVVQFEMRKMTKDCEGRCHTRKSEFKAKLVQSFTRNGYVIGGCKGSETDNVVLEEDIDAIVEEIVKKCLLQCPVTTFKCRTLECRQIATPITQVGKTDQDIDIEYGVGGCADGCPGNTPGCTDSACDPTSGNCENSEILSRCQQKKWKQVMTWDFEIDMPSMLDLDNDGNSDRARKFNCHPSPNMADYTEVESILTNGVMPDPFNIKLGKTVSPAVEINVSLPGKN
jgi:hypothetical protein